MLNKNQSIHRINTEKEIEKFNQLANEWRNPNGKFKHVIAFNHTRLKNIKAAIATHFHRDQHQQQPFSNISLLDIGCGAGLLSEPLAKDGALVTGIDASKKNIAIATSHAESQSLSINYQHAYIETFFNKNGDNPHKYDIILNTEVIEHVNEKTKLVQTCCQLLNPGGLLIMATLNRTIKSFIVAIVGAEYIMRYLPIGTHQWKHFVKPQEIINVLKSQNINLVKLQGISLNPLTGQWKTHKNTDVNYLLYAKKSK